MKLEVLVSTMNQTDFSLVNKMSLQTDTIIINQSNFNGYEMKIVNNNNIQMYTFDEKGVGLSRNNALMRSKADICLMADDDMIYVDEYEKIVLKAFNDYPDADMIMFEVPIYKDGQVKTKVKKNGKVHLLNGLKYGTVNIAFKREAILKKNIFFSLLFGGGARYGSGEDSLFIREALKNKLKVYSCTDIIAEIKESGSTWFSGYNEKYLFDRGALFRAMFGKVYILFIIQFIIRHKRLYSPKIQMLQALKWMIKGGNDFDQK